MNRTLLDEAWKLLRIAQDACRKLRLDGRGSDISLPHEVRMFTLDFSPEGREGPGELQVTGSGRVEQWFKDARAEWSRGWRPVATCKEYPHRVLIGVPPGGEIVGRLVQHSSRQPIREVFGSGTVFIGYVYYSPPTFELIVLDAERKVVITGGPFFWQPFPQPPQSTEKK